MATPDGYPLSYFAGTEPFSSLFRKIVHQKLKHLPENERLAQSALPEWFQHIRLTQFKANPPSDVKEDYEYKIEFSVWKKVRVLLDEPKGTIAIIDVYKNGDDISPGKLNLRFVLEKRSRRIRKLDIEGDVQFQLPRGLVRPVHLNELGKWVDSGKDERGGPRFVIVPLGAARISLAREVIPKFSQPLKLPRNTIARIGRSGMVAKLGSIDIAGRREKPELRFQGLEIVFRGI